MEEKYLSVLGGPARLEARAGQGPSQAQVLAWVDEVFHDLRQNKVSLIQGLSRISKLPQDQKWHRYRINWIRVKYWAFTI